LLPCIISSLLSQLAPGIHAVRAFSLSTFCRHLVQQHPDVLDANMAERFFVSYPSSNKAFVALRQCVVRGAASKTLASLISSPCRCNVACQLSCLLRSSFACVCVCC
jgi:hypothetical protein